MPKFLAAVLLLLASPIAVACGCDKPRTPADVRSYVHMFKGEVVTVTTSINHQEKFQTVTFNVLERLGGPNVQTVTISFGGTTSCDLQEPDFSPGQKYLISDFHQYLAKDNIGVTDAKKLRPSGLYAGNFCSLREPLPVEVPEDGI